MVTTDDAELAAHMRLLRGQGQDPERRYWFPVVGYNYRMTNIPAAIGLAQTRAVRRPPRRPPAGGRLYDQHLADLADPIQLPVTRPGCTNVCWLYTSCSARASPSSATS